MKKIISIVLLLINFSFADSIDNLLNEYKDSVEKSLQTVDEKFGHVIVYTQRDLQLMQHNKLSDILQELPFLTLNRNRLGTTNLSLPGSKTSLSGYFRLFINDTEVSSLYTESFALSWGEMPLDFIDHVEVYYGESSFSLSDETGLYFIRLYTKSAQKENGSQYSSVFSNKSSTSQSLTNADSFENGWSYLLFLNQSKSNVNGNELLSNNMKNRYFFADINNDTTKINIGYSDIVKDIFSGNSIDAIPDDGSIESKDYFVTIGKSFLNDNSLKVGASYAISKTKYKEMDENGIWKNPFITSIENIDLRIPKKVDDNLETSKKSAYINKIFNFKNNQISASVNIQEKKFNIINRISVSSLDEVKIADKKNKFDNETVSSLVLTDSYTLYDNIVLIGNAKFDKYNRHGYLNNTNEKMYRLGLIYTPFENLGFKSFYTKTYLPPSLYSVDYASSQNKELKSQIYKHFTTEAVFTTQKSKIALSYSRMILDNLIYENIIGFENLDLKIKREGLGLYFKYNLFKNNTIIFNYYIVKTNVKDDNSDRGGNFKYILSYKDFEYFTSLTYKNKYVYKPIFYNSVSVKDSYNLNLGVTYNFNDDVSVSIKGENLLDKSTKSLYTNGYLETNYTLDDFEKTISLAIKWRF